MQDIDYEGFRLFMDTYLELEMQEELCKRLFLSFVKRAPAKNVSSVEGKVIKVRKSPTADLLRVCKRRRHHFL